MDAPNKNRSEPAGVTKDRDSKRRARDAERHEKLDDALEVGLEDSFPGSDPVSITQPPHSVRDKCETRKS